MSTTLSVLAAVAAVLVAVWIVVAWWLWIANFGQSTKSPYCRYLRWPLILIGKQI